MAITIDLYHNHEVFIKEARQEWDVGNWLKSKGINLNDLDGHDQINDVITLINIKDQLYHRMSYREQCVWNAYWGIVYKHKYPLNNKFWRKLENIVKSIDERESVMAQHRQRIKALRTNNENMDQNNEAKGSDLPEVTYTKWEQQGCREVSA